MWVRVSGDRGLRACCKDRGLRPSGRWYRLGGCIGRCWGEGWDMGVGVEPGEVGLPVDGEGEFHFESEC